MSTAKPTSTLAPEVRPERPVQPAVQEYDWAQNTPNGIYARFGRRCVDAALLAVCLPIAIAPGILLATINAFATGSLRKIFYTQDRVGLGGKIFRIYKFRTMRDVAESDLQSWSSGQDRARVTTFGRFLRSSHLDELPQLINVAKGDMSFIGPRPEMVEIETWAASEVAGFTERLCIRPGITGFAQITQGYTARDRDAYQRKLDLCLSYNQSISLAVDISILWQTGIWMLRGKGWQWQDGKGRLAQTASRVLESERTFESDCEPQAALPAETAESEMSSAEEVR